MYIHFNIFLNLLQGEREKKPRTEKRAATTSKPRSSKRSYDDYSDPDEPISYTYRRNDSYEDDTGFVVADENDSDEDYGRPEKKRKGKERAIESRRKRDLSPDEDLPRVRKRRLEEDKEENLDEFEDNDQEERYDEDVDMSPERPTKRAKEDVEEIDADIDMGESLSHEEDDDMPVVKRKRNRIIIGDDEQTISNLSNRKKFPNKKILLISDNQICNKCQIE